MTKASKSKGKHSANQISPGQSVSRSAATQGEDSGTAGAAPALPKRRGRPRKRIGIGNALRQRGFDEHALAENYIEVTQRLKGKAGQGGSVEKLLIDVLKECSKYIEPARPTDERQGRAPVHIHLVHNVMRPARALPASPALPHVDVCSDSEPTGSPVTGAADVEQIADASDAARSANGDAGSEPGAVE